MSHHMIRNYRRSFMLIIKQQCLLEAEQHEKASAALSLAETMDLNRLLSGRHLDSESLVLQNMQPILEEDFISQQS